jgi:hypothetical protein
MGLSLGARPRPCFPGNTPHPPTHNPYPQPPPNHPREAELAEQAAREHPDA